MPQANTWLTCIEYWQADAGLHVGGAGPPGLAQAGTSGRTGHAGSAAGASGSQEGAAAQGAPAHGGKHTTQLGNGEQVS